MKKKNTDGLYSAGQTVYAKIAPGIELVVRRYVDDIYYCRVAIGHQGHDLVYFERELTTDPKSHEPESGQPS